MRVGEGRPGGAGLSRFAKSLKSAGRTVDKSATFAAPAVTGAAARGEEAPMTTGTWMLTGLLLLAGALPADVVPMGSSKFQIPINLDPTRRAEVRELILYVSNDQGKTWKQQASVPPTEGAFSFYAPADGEYWFSVCVVNQQNKQEPEDVYKAPVSQKVLVDTQKPELRLVAADRSGDTVVVRWEAKDANLDPSTLKLEYRTPEAPADVWYPVALSAPGPSGEEHFRPGSLGPVQLRLQVKDLAENTTTISGEVAAAAGAAATTAQAAPAPPPPPVPSALPSDGPGWTGSHVASPASFQRVDAPPAFTNPTLGAAPPVVTGPGPAGQQVVASSQPAPASANPLPAAAALPGPAVPRQPGPAPPVQIIKDHQITLQYTVNGCGPSGLGSVELYVTRDDGQTWTSSGAQPVNAVPTLDAKGNPAPLQLSLPVTLPEEGAYGFYVVVKNKAGGGMKPPQPGTPPRLRVEVDTTLPVVDLYNPVPKPGAHNAIVLSWEVRDRNLAPKSITLAWSDRPNGEWNVIAQDLPNSPNQYVWQLPADTALPPKVYLRITAQDLAGNVATAVTPEPVLIDVSEPTVENVQLGVALPH